MRGVRFLALGCLAAALIAGCGSSVTSSPLSASLSYFAKGSPFVLKVVTDPNAPAVKGFQAMLHQIPFASFGEAALIGQLQKKGVNYDSDIRPLFGNPAFLGLASPNTGGGARANLLVAWVTKDAGVLSSLVRKLGLHQTGSHDGATLYGSRATTVAIDGATLVGGTRVAVLAALDRHARGQGMSPSDYNAELGSLPKSSLINAFGDLSGLLGSPKAAEARSIPWVAALRSYGVSISAGSGGLTFAYTLNTTGASLTSSELPITPGTSPPGLAGTMPIQFGLREPAATLNFLLDLARRTSPAHYSADLAQMAAIKRRTGVDFRHDVLAQIGNNAALESMGRGATIVRIDVVNPAAAARTLRRLGTSALDVLGTHPGAYVTPGPGSFETVHNRRHHPILFGLVGSEFVVGSATPAQLQAFAALPAVAATGAQGAAAFRISLPELISLFAGKSSSSSTTQAVLSALGDITGWVSSSTSALTGSATLAVR